MYARLGTQTGFQARHLAYAVKILWVDGGASINNQTQNGTKNKSMKIVKAPNEFREDNTQARTLKVFLAGSIEMGAAENWQDKVDTFHKTKK